MKRTFLGTILAMWAIGSLASTVAAAPPAEVRLALVVGTNDYPGRAQLTNPVQDAAAIAQALGDGGFETPASVVRAAEAPPANTAVTALRNATRIQLIKAVGALKEQAAAAAAAGKDVTIVFYFGGHGVQFNGVNYLIPRGTTLFRDDGAPPPSEADYKAETIKAQEDVLDELISSGARRVIVFLDACRTNPFNPKMRDVTLGDGGLASMQVPSGDAAAMIFYAAAPRRPAQDTADGVKANSPFARALDDFLSIPGLRAGEVFANVRERVNVMTRGFQNPYFEGSPVFDFQFHPAVEQRPVDIRPAASLAATPAAPAAAESPRVPTVADAARGTLNDDGRRILQAALQRTSIDEMRRLAEGGEAFSQWMLAVAYLDGVQVPKDGAQARFWARSAILKGLSRATVTLGYLYQHGVGGEASPQEAVGWYQIGERAGEPTAQGALAWYYMTGSGGLPKDMARAKELFTKAADAGQPYAREMLATYFK